jgi:hypothetical protein
MKKLGPLSTVLSLTLAVVASSGVRAQSTQPAAERPWIRMLGENADDAVNLLWQPDRWQPDVDGFVVARRKVDEQAWQLRTQAPITPGVSRQKDLSNVEASPAQRQRLQAALPSLFRDDGEQRAAAILSKGLANATPTEFNWISMLLTLDFDRARVMGFGFTDRGVDAATDYEYGLFAVRKGVQDQQPTTVFRPFSSTDPAITPTNVRAARSPAGATVEWEYAQDKIQKYGVVLYNVYRTEAGQTVATKLTPEPVVGGPVRQGLQKNVWVDRTPDKGKTYTYAVAAVNVFKHEIGPWGTAQLPNAAAAPAVPLPADLKKILTLNPAATNDRRQVELSWTLDPAVEPQIQGFIVERGPVESRVLDAVSKVLPKSSRSFVDTDAPFNGNYYAYRVTAMGEKGPVANSGLQMLRLVDLTKPPAPAGVKALIVAKDGKRFIRLSWDAKTKTDSITQDYVIYTDEVEQGKPAWQSNLPKVTGTTYDLELHNREERPLIVGVAAVGKEGQQSTHADVSLVAPGKIMPQIRPAVVERKTTAEPLTIRWEYPDLTYLRGFRIFLNGKLAADEKIVTTRERSWKYAAMLREGETYAFSIVAVSPDGMLSEPSVASSYVTRKPDEVAVRRPEASGAWADVGGKRVIRLTWSAPEGVEAVRGYRIEADEVNIDNFKVVAAEVPVTATEFAYAVPKSDRSYSFRIIPIDRSGQNRSSAEVLVLAPGRTLPPATLRTVSVLDADKGLIKWSWTYPALPDLKGFRVYQDGQLVADEDTLKPDVREWTFEPLAPGKQHQFEMEAVGQTGAVSERGARRYYSIRMGPSGTPSPRPPI